MEGITEAEDLEIAESLGINVCSTVHECSVCGLSGSESELLPVFLHKSDWVHLECEKSLKTANRWPKAPKVKVLPQPEWHQKKTYSQICFGVRV